MQAGFGVGYLLMTSKAGVSEPILFYMDPLLVSRTCVWPVLAAKQWGATRVSPSHPASIS